MPAWEGTEATKHVDIFAWNTQRLLPQCLTALLLHSKKLSHSEMFQDRTIFFIVASARTQMQVEGELGRIDYGQMSCFMRAKFAHVQM